MHYFSNERTSFTRVVTLSQFPVTLWELQQCTELETHSFCFISTRWWQWSPPVGFQIGFSPDVPGVAWMRIQHQILRSHYSFVTKGCYGWFWFYTGSRFFPRIIIIQCFVSSPQIRKKITWVRMPAFPYSNSIAVYLYICTFTYTYISIRTV